MQWTFSALPDFPFTDDKHKNKLINKLTLNDKNMNGIQLYDCNFELITPFDKTNVCDDNEYKVHHENRSMT